MPITFGQAREVLAKYADTAGKNSSSEDVATFVRTVLDYMLNSGAYGSMRRFTFQAVNGVITVPYELETPEKIKIDNDVGTVKDRWFEWYPSHDGILKDCYSAEESLTEDPNYYPTVYDLPVGGSCVAVIGTTFEDDDAHVLVQGKDVTGREIFTDYKGEQITGIRLDIKRGQAIYSPIVFGEITAVIKTRTKGYVQLVAYDKNTQKKTFLSDYSPFEELPRYRRFRLKKPCNSVAKVTILGRIRLKDYYSDADIIPFDNRYALTVAASAIQAQANDNMQLAAAKDNTMMELLSRENATKRIQNGKPLEVSPITSPGGSIRSIIPTNPWASVRMRRFGSFSR